MELLFEVLQMGKYDEKEKGKSGQIVISGGEGEQNRTIVSTGTEKRQDKKRRQEENDT